MEAKAALPVSCDDVVEQQILGRVLEVDTHIIVGDVTEVNIFSELCEDANPLSRTLRPS